MKPDHPFIYRLMRDDEAHIVFDLVLRVFHHSVAPTYSPIGTETFLNMLTVEFFNDEESNQFTIVAENQGRIVGMLTNVSTGHIALLFVDSTAQGSGVGNGLIQYYLDVCRWKFPKLRTVTVSSSPNSVSFYEKAGFDRLSEEQDDNGLRFTPMQISLRTSE